MTPNNFRRGYLTYRFRTYAVQAEVLCSSRFVKQEQWERWRAKLKLVSGYFNCLYSKHRALLRGSGNYGGITLEKKFEIVYAKSCNLVHFWPENGSQCRP